MSPAERFLELTEQRRILVARLAALERELPRLPPGGVQAQHHERDIEACTAEAEALSVEIGTCAAQLRRTGDGHLLDALRQGIRR